MMQRFIGVGRIEREPVLRYTRGNRPCLTLDVKFDDRYKEKRESLWIDVVCWDRLATSIHARAKKGDQLIVEGVLVRVEWTPPKRPNDTRTRIEIRAIKAQLIERTDPEPKEQEDLPLGEAEVSP